MRRFLATVPVLLLLAALLPALAVAAQDAPATVVQRFFEARNRYDVPGTLALVTDDFRFVGGPACTPASPCLGREGLRAHLQQEFIPQRAQATIVGAPQVSGTTVVVRIEVRSDLIRRAGVERVVNTVTLEVRGAQLASYVGVPDASDAQTAQFLAWLQSQPGTGAPPPGMPNTGGGGQAADAAGGLRTLLPALALMGLGLAGGLGGVRLRRREGR